MALSMKYAKIYDTLLMRDCSISLIMATYDMCSFGNWHVLRNTARSFHQLLAWEEAAGGLG